MKKIDSLKEIILYYKNEGFLETWHETELIKIFEKSDLNNLYYSCKSQLSKEEKKLFVNLLKRFASIDDTFEVPLGKILETGYGSAIQLLIKKFTPWWTIFLCECWKFGSAFIIFGLLTSWLFDSWAIGFIITGFSISCGWYFQYIPAIYLQNELLIRRQNRVTKKRREKNLHLFDQ